MLTVAIIALNVVVFLIETWIINRTQFPLGYYCALHFLGLVKGYYWQLLTYQFLHGGWVHLLLNCWGIFIFGSAVESTIGRWRMLVLYLGSGVIGGLFQIAASLAARHWFVDIPVVGASAGVFGLVAAFTTLFPQARMTVLMFFVIPVRMTASRLLMVAAVISVIGMVFPNWLLGRNVAHAAHLGGLIGGLLLVRFFTRRFEKLDLV